MGLEDAQTAESTEPAPQEPDPKKPAAKVASRDPADPLSRVGRADAIVRRKVLWALGVGILPIPIVDMLGVAGLQLDMLKELSDLYEVAFSKDAAKKVIVSLASALGGVSLGAMAAMSLVKLIPPVGAALALLSMPLAAGAFTHATGKIFIMHFESGGSFLDFDPAALRAHFLQEFERAKRTVAEMKDDEV